jgi:hypothetical protein
VCKSREELQAFIDAATATFGLKKLEVLQIINLRPQEEVELISVSVFVGGMGLA